MGGYNLLYSCYSYAIGGLAGGEDKDSFWRVVAQCTAALPDDKPRYVMVQKIWPWHLPFLSIFLVTFFLIHWIVIFWLIFSGCWLSTRYCSLQRFRCWYVWLCLSHTHSSLWHSSYSWGTLLSPLPSRIYRYIYMIWNFTVNIKLVISRNIYNIFFCCAKQNTYTEMYLCSLEILHIDFQLICWCREL